MRLLNQITSWFINRQDHEFDEPDFQAGTPALTAKRFKELFVMHGIEISEIPEVKGFEDITLYDLHSDDRLLQKLTPTFLEKTAEYFGIEIEWLRSGDSRIYFQRNWYKNLPNFFEDLKAVDFNNIYDPFEIITTVDQLDKNSNESQPFTFILKKYMGNVGEKYIFRYYIETLWNWHHAPCRLQAKALATKYYQLTGRMITITKVSSEQLQKIACGYLPPHDLGLRNHKISFEEYGAAKLPHMQPFEIEEFDGVIKTIKDYEIESYTHEYVSNSAPDSSDVPSKNKGRKPSKVKKEIKDRFIAEFVSLIDSKELSADEAARRFFSSLQEFERVILFRSPKEYEKLTYEEALFLAERTLSGYYAQYKKGSM